MSLHKRSSRVTALAITIALGTAGITTVPVTAQDLPGNGDSPIIEQEQNTADSVIDLDDYVPASYLGLDVTDKSVTNTIILTPGETATVTPATVLGDVTGVELRYSGYTVDELNSGNVGHFTSWVADLYEYDEATGELTINSPEDYPQFSEHNNGTSLVVSGRSVSPEEFYENGSVEFIIEKADGFTETIALGHTTVTPINVEQGHTEDLPVSGPEGSFDEEGTSVVDWVTTNDTGEYVASPGYDVTPGDYDLYLYGYNSTDETASYEAEVRPGFLNVTPANLNEDFIPSYPVSDISWDDNTADIDVTYEGFSPSDRTRYALADTAEIPEGWTVTVAEETGIISVEADPATAIETVTIPVDVTYVDGTVDNVTATVNFTPPVSDGYSPVWEDLTVDPGVRSEISYIGDDIPEDAEISLSGLPRGWATGINDDNSIVVTSPYDLEDDSTHDLTVTVTYADGSTDEHIVTITINNPDAGEIHELSYNSDQAVAKGGFRDYSPQFTGGDPETSDFTIQTEHDWITIDENTGIVTAAPGDDVDAGTVGYATVTVEYSDGSTDTAEISVTVYEMISDSVDVSYGPSEVRMNQIESVLPDFVPDSPDSEITYSLIGSAPSWVSIDEITGQVTFAPTTTTPLGDTSVDVAIRYADGSEDVTSAGVTVQDLFNSERTDLGYEQNRTAPRGDTTTTSPSVSPSVPEGTVFSIDADPELFTINSTTGEVTITPGASYPVDNGAVSATVTATYPDESVDTAVVSFVVSAMSTGNNPVGYTTHDVAQGTTGVFTPINEDGDYTYFLREGAPAWVSIDEDTGTITAEPGYRVPAGDRSIVVDFIYPDGSTGSTIVDMTITQVEQSTWLDPQYPTVNVVAGRITDSSRPNFGFNGQPIGNVLYEIYGVSWANVDSYGVVSVNPPVNLEGTTEYVPVKITYSDGSTDTTEIRVNIGSRDHSDVYQPSYRSVNIAQEKSTTVNVNFSPSAPEGATFSRVEGFPEWASVASNGAITLNPTFSGTTLGTHNLPVQVRYPDGTTERTSLSVTVTRGSDRDNYDISYLGGTTEQGETLRLDPQIRDYNGVTADPDNVVYRLVNGPEWLTVNTSTGVVTARPAVGTPLDSYDFTVEVVYADGTRENINSGVTVSGTTDAVRYQFSYGTAARVEQGDVLEGNAPNLTVGGTAPEDVLFTPVDVPEWLTVNEDGSYFADPGYNVEGGTYPSEVAVTYPDGSTENITLSVTVTVADIVKDYHSPEYESITVTQGQETKSGAPLHDERILPEGTTYRLQYGAPSWVNLDTTTGVITATPGFRVNPGEHVIPVTVEYADGSSTETELTIRVQLGRYADGYAPAYSSGIDVPQGARVTIPAPRGASGETLPPNTKYDGHEDNPEWVSVGVDGTVTASPGFDIEEGSYQTVTVVTYEDGTTDTIPVSVRVTPGVDPNDVPVTSVPGGFTDYSEEYIPSWQRSEGGTSSSVDEGDYTVNDDGTVVDSDGNPVAGASVDEQGQITVPGDDAAPTGGGTSVTVTQPDDDIDGEQVGPDVNTGGSVTSTGLLDSIKNLFR